jgi:hypothetical protein
MMTSAAQTLVMVGLYDSNLGLTDTLNKILRVCRSAMAYQLGLEIEGDDSLKVLPWRGVHSSPGRSNLRLIAKSSL